MKIEESKTRIFKGRDGWQGRTVRTEKGQTFEITTMKRHSGDVITTVTKVTIRVEGSFISTSFGMNDSFMLLNHGKIRATEASIKAAHYEDLAKFDIKVNELPAAAISPEFPEVGDILFLDGYGKTKGSEENHWIIYKIEDSKFGKNYFCIEKDTLKLEIKDYLKPWSKKFGIGTYFEKGFNMSIFRIDENKLSDMLIEAQDVKRKAEENKRIQDEQNRQEAAERKKYLSQFIQADRGKTTRIIKAHCLKNFKISKIEVSTEVFSMGDSMRVKYYAPAKIDELETFIKSFQEGHFNGMEDIYEYYDRSEIILDGHILQTYKYVFVDLVETEETTQEEEQKQPEDPAPSEWWIDELLSEKSDIQIIDYSEKAIAVIGDTKRIKDQLKALGGRFNFRLSCGAGWIFPKSKKEQILSII